MFEAVAKVIAETGVLAGRGKRCLDSTVFDDAVATQDTVTQLGAAIRKVGREVPGAAAVIERVCWLDYAQPGKPAIEWDDPQAKQALVSDLVNDALAVLAELTGENTPQREGKAADALGLLALIAGQDVEPAEGSDGTDGRWRIARKVAHDRVISTVDPETRHTRKSKSVRRDGYRGHVATEPETGLITDCQLTKAAGDQGSDPVVGEQMISRDRYHHARAQDNTTNTGQTDAAVAPTGHEHDAAESDESGQSLEVYADSAYGTGQARAKYRQAGHDMVIKPKPLRPAVPGGFTLDDFVVDEATGTVTGPGGHTRPMGPKRTATFGKVCADCPLRSRCTTAADGRTVAVHPHEDLLRAARAQARTAEFKQAYPIRSTVERIIAWTATHNGRRVKLRYVGATKNDAWFRTRCAAINLRTLITRGLTRQHGPWALA